MGVLRVGPLPDEPLRAAHAFYTTVLKQIDPAGEAALTLLFEPADHTHRAWRLAAVQGLARQFAPVRINALAGGDKRAIAAADAYLAQAPGVTGQYLPLVSHAGTT